MQLWDVAVPTIVFAMDDFLFLADWGNNKQAAWSGTCWGLFTALQEHREVTDWNLSEGRTQAFYHKLMRKLHLEKDDFSIAHIGRQRRRLQRLLDGKACTVFQFSEILHDTGQRKTFIYQDLSADYVRYMYGNKQDVFPISGFGNRPSDAVERRAALQDEYYKTCSGIFTMGQWFAKDLVDRCGIPKNKVHHAGGGINLDKSLIDYSMKTGNKVLFVGRDFIRKGGPITLKAFKKLKGIMPDAELYVAGPAKNPLPEGTDGYHYMGECSHAELSGLFNKCDIFVMPSYFEAYGLVFIEALAYGLPCIGRNAYEMPYFIENGKTGLLLEEDDAGQLALMMKRLLEDDSMKANVRALKGRYLDEYSWDSVARRILDVIG